MFSVRPKTRVSVTELKRRLVLLGIILFQPEQLVNRVHRVLHRVSSRLALCASIRISRRNSENLFLREHFDGAVAERQCDYALSSCS